MTSAQQTASLDGRRRGQGREFSALGERYRRAAAVLAVGGAAAMHGACADESACKAELGVCVEAEAALTIPKGGNAILGDVRFVMDDITTNLNGPAARLRLTAISSPGCREVEQSGNSTRSYSVEKTLAEGVINVGQSAEISVPGRTYVVSLGSLSGDAGTFGVSVQCPEQNTGGNGGFGGR